MRHSNGRANHHGLSGPHHHHHGGHHGGGGIPPFVYAGPFPGYQEPSTVIVNQASCPPVNDPVVGSDGRIYPNACEANSAGARVVRHVRPGVAGLGADMTTNALNIGAILFVGYLAYRTIFGK